MKINTLNPATTLSKTPTYYTLEFGDVKRNSDTTTVVQFTAENIESLSMQAACGCTATDVKKISPGLWEGTLKYKDTHIAAAFNKTVIINYKEVGKPADKKQLKLKGNVL